MLAKLALSIAITGTLALPTATRSPTSPTFNSVPGSPTLPVFNVDAPSSATPVHLAPKRPVLLSEGAVQEELARMRSGHPRSFPPRSLDSSVAVDSLFRESKAVGDTLVTRQTNSACLDSTANETLINSLFYYGGPSTVVSLCPNAVINLSDMVFFTDANQELSTLGHPSDSTRAMLVVTGVNQTGAIYGPCDLCTNATLRFLQINGNRAGLGWSSDGYALIEMGGNAPGQTIDNVHAFDPRAWSVLHGIEGYNNNCRGMVITNNQIGPSGHAPNTGMQFRKRDSTGNYNPGQWADGISLACSGSLVQGNTVTDATDGGIVCFTCNSLITMNTIISADRQLLGGINMVDVGPNSFNYTGVVVSSNTIIARSNFIKVGIAVGGMVWGTDNRTASRTFGGSITNNVLSSGPSGYFGFGIAVGGHQNAVISGNTATTGNWGGEPSNVCLAGLVPTPQLRPSSLEERELTALQQFVIDPTNTPGVQAQTGFGRAPIAFLICQEPGAIVGTGTTASNTTTTSSAPQMIPANDLALNATVTVSSFYVGQPGSGATDGVIGGYSPDPQVNSPQTEWSSNGETSHAWLNLTWPSAIRITAVVLYDRINLDDHITSGQLVFSDGTVVAVPSLNNDGTAVSVAVPSVVASSLLFQVLNTASTTSNSGLAEIVVLGSTNTAASASSASSTVVSSSRASSSTSPLPISSTSSSVAKLSSSSASSSIAHSSTSTLSSSSASKTTSKPATSSSNKPVSSSLATRPAATAITTVLSGVKRAKRPAKAKVLKFKSLFTTFNAPPVAAY